MDPEQTFLRVHARLSGVLARLLTPKFRAILEYLCLFNAAMLMALLVVMHVNFVAQPGCSMEFLGEDVADAQLMQVKITGSWNLVTEGPVTSHVMHEGAVEDTLVLDPIPKDNDEKSKSPVDLEGPYPKVEGWNILVPKIWLNLMSSNARRSQSVTETFRVEKEFYADGHAHKLNNEDISSKEFLAQEVISRPLGSGRDHFGTALLHNLAKWSSHVAVSVKRAEQSMRSFWQVWGRSFITSYCCRRYQRITGWEPFTASPKGDRRGAAWSKLDPLLDKGRKVLDPTYLYSVEKGYLMLSETAKVRHAIKTVNVTISAQNSCFGNRWQQLLIDNFVGYDTILMNSLQHARGKGYLYNFQTKELYNLNYLQEFSGVPHGIEDYVVFKCGVLITSLFVFFTTTMSVSFTLRETQARMLKFTVQLQHHAWHRLPTYRLIFVHVVESLVFVPIMIGILFFLFEFFDDQLLAFMVLTLVWLCELYTMISVRTPFSMRYFPRFFFLYFMVFHIYFFSYTYGFSYLAFSATGAFMQHLVLYFWNQFEVPALQNFLRRRALFQQQGLHISSAIVQVARLTNSSSILGNSPSDALNDVSQRTGNPELGELNAANSEGNLFSPEGLATRSSQGSVYPVSLRNLGPFSVNGNNAMFESEGIRNSTLRSLILSSPSQDVVPGEMVSPRRIPVGVDAGVRRVDEGVTGSASSGNTTGNVYGDSASESQGPTRNAVHSGGTLSSLGAVLPWIIGSGTATVISLLPSFREFGEDHQELTVAVTSDQQGGEESLAGRARNDSRLRRRPIPARP